MPIRVKCDGCKKTLSVKDHLAGKKIKCPVCQSVVAVSPAPKAPPPTAAPATKPTAEPTKPGALTKPAATTKPPIDKSKSNGTPSPAETAGSNGTPAPPAPIELSPENVEEEALAAFADEPKPPEELAEPQFIDFKCDWCDENVKLPIELAGKQSQCPNPECKRIVKVPLPKKAEKKDWRKMDRKGPAAAIVSQPEQLADAWGTQDATRARQASLAQAGAIAEPVKRPVGMVGWMFRVFYGVCAVLVLGFASFGIFKLVDSKQQHNTLKEAESLVAGSGAKIKQPVLVGEANRTIALLWLREGKRGKAKEYFQSAQFGGASEGVNEQLFLIDLALSQIELGGEDDDLLTKKKFEWALVRGDMAATLDKITNPEVRTMALREVGTHLIEKKQPGIAVGLASQFGSGAKPPAPRRQLIALLCELGQEEKQDQKKPVAGKEPDSNARVGYAEGLARQDKFDEAWVLAKLPGSGKDKLDAFLGIGAVAWQRKNKDKANDCVTESRALANDKFATDWQRLQLVRLAARVERIDEIKEIIKKMKGPFQTRAHLEIFLALCERTTSAVNADALQELEVADKDGATLALAWMALAQHNTRKGTSRDRNRAAFEERIITIGAPTEIADKIRPMVDIGSYLGDMK